jgi:hypothetical protein
MEQYNINSSAILKAIRFFMFGRMLCWILDSHTGDRSRSLSPVLARLNSILSRSHTHSRLANLNFMIVKCFPLGFVPHGYIQEENNSPICVSLDRFNHQMKRQEWDDTLRLSPQVSKTQRSSQPSEMLMLFSSIHFNEANQPAPQHRISRVIGDRSFC